MPPSKPETCLYLNKTGVILYFCHCNQIPWKGPLARLSVLPVFHKLLMKLNPKPQNHLCNLTECSYFNPKYDLSLNQLWPIQSVIKTVQKA